MSDPPISPNCISLIPTELQCIFNQIYEISDKIQTAIMSSALCLVALVSVIVIHTIGSSLTSRCSYTNPKYGNTTFNFWQLQLQSGGQLDYYIVGDSTVDQGQAAYKYYFNLCAPVLELPSSVCNKTTNGEIPTYCDKIDTVIGGADTCGNDQDQRPKITGKAYAYQMNVDETECYPLSNDATDGSNMAISLYDDLDPTQGIKIHYKYGEWADYNCGANRELIINLKCEDEPSSIPRESDVTEYADECKYEMTIYTMHGCPSGCSAYANSLCAAQGLCGYDFGSNVSRCFCYWGYKGSACERVKDISSCNNIYMYKQW